MVKRAELNMYVRGEGWSMQRHREVTAVASPGRGGELVSAGKPTLIPHLVP